MKENVFRKRTLAITLFEDQLVRNYLSGDSGYLFFALSENFELVVITNTDLIGEIRRKVGEFGLDGLKIVSFDSYSESRLTRFTSFLLHWTLNTGTMRVKLNRVSGLKKTIRHLISRTSKLFLLLRPLMRNIYRKTIKQTKVQKCFSEDAIEVDVVFITSLTNLYEDVPVAVFYEKMGVPVVGTVRSWDNLTSHGHLRFLPDLFLSHSTFMSGNAALLHGLPSKSIFSLSTPPYRRVFQNNVNKEVGSETVVRVLFPSLGIHANPDEQNLLERILLMWETLPENYVLTVLQHPKFNYSISSKSKRVSVFCLPYLRTNLSEYFSFLRNHEVVVSGGTSVALDATFIGVPVITINFEIERQTFWNSHLRSFDYYDHTKSFFADAKFQSANSIEELKRLLLKSEFRKAPYRAVESIMGMETESFDNKMIAAINSIVDL